MGDNYSTRMCVKFRKSGDEEKAIIALQDYIEKGGTDGNTEFSLDEQRKEGVLTRTFDDLMRIFFAGWASQPLRIGEEKVIDGHYVATRYDSNGFVKYENDFSCSYGWQGVMWDMFDTIAPFLAEHSSLAIDADEGGREVEIENGEVVEIDSWDEDGNDEEDLEEEERDLENCARKLGLLNNSQQT